MSQKNKKSMDGNTAAAHIAYAFSEVCGIYPITPSSNMGEMVDMWAAQGRKNLFDEVVEVAEMQSEGGAAGCVHGALSAGALCSTFTASQGLLLMVPNMYKIAGELMPCVFHVSARALAGQALSIFGDHQDVMAARQTGFCQIASCSVQEAMDLALVSHLATLKASLPFLHFFDGFRTSHEIQKIDVIDYEDIKPLVDEEAIEKHRKRALNPEHPHLRGSAQNPDIYFQMMEAANPFYDKVPEIVEKEMEKVSQLTGRSYHLFDYYGAEDAENVIVMMGSGAETAEETIHYLNGKGEKLGLVKVRLFRPFSVHHFIQALPKSVKKIAVLDRTKESGCLGEPLYLDVATAIKELKMDIEVVGGRYGLGSKDFTPAQVKTVFDNLKREEVKNHFTVGIVDDVTYLSLPMEEVMDTEDKDAVRCMFWGIGGDGTVGANKDAIKIIGDNTEKYVQGYFSYDSKKSGGVTISHLRFGKRPIHSTYLIQVADYVACHQSSYLQKGLPILDQIKPGGIFVLNSMWEKEELERNLPNKVKKQMAEKNIQFYHVNAIKIAKDIGLGSRINMIMQTVFFKLSNVLPIEKAIQLLKDAIVKSYGRKGEKIVQMNHAAVDEALNHLEKIEVPSSWKDLEETETFIDASRPDYVKNIADVMNRQEGDLLPVSAFLPGGILPSETTKYEKRSIATIVPEWIAENCIQCNQCSFVCPHAAIRPFLLTEEEAAKAPEGYVGIKPLGRGYEGLKYSIQVTPSDCTGCGNCAQVCPAMKKALHMTDIHEVEKRQKELWDYVTTLPNRKGKMSKYTLKGSQFEKPLLEFSGACAGCGETPYVKLVTQLFGNRMIIANATGCSSIWGGSAPSVPWALTDKGEGPAWANSLFEDNAEYGFGMAISVEYRRDELKKFVERAVSENAVSTELQELLKQWLEAYLIGDHSKELSYQIKPLLEKESSPLADEMKKRQDLFAKPSVWIMGGDGWAYDIGYGGLDHVLAMNRNVNILVLDTEVYSNTGGQASKSTPLGSVAKFAFDGKKTQKKDLGKIAMAYGNVYVATASMGYDKPGVVRALKEAEEYDGPSIVIVYATCIAHGIQKGGMGMSQDEQKKAVESGFWVNYRYDPRRSFEGKNPFQLDSKEPTIPLKEFLKGEVRFNSLLKTDPEEAALLQDELQNHYQKRFEEYKKMASEE